MLMNCLAVGVGGFAGSVLRYLFGLAVPDSQFPVATLAVNVLGCFALAAVTSLAAAGAIADERTALLMGVGLCGGLTTFSTFSLQAVQMIQSGTWGMAGAYVTLSLCLGAAGTLLGFWVTRAV